MTVFCKLKNLRILTDTFFNYQSNEDVLLCLLSVLFEECYRDSPQCQFLIFAYYQAQKKQKQNKINQLLQHVEHQYPQLTELSGDCFKIVLNKIDIMFENKIRQCYKDFQSITEPILSQSEVLSLVKLHKFHLPDYYNTMKHLFGYHSKENLAKNMHLKDSCYYD